MDMASLLSPVKFAMNAEDMRSSAKLTLINPPQFSLTSNKVACIIESSHYFYLIVCPSL